MALDLSPSRTKITELVFYFFLPLLFCATVYSLFRSNHTVFYQVLISIFDTKLIDGTRLAISNQIALPDWLVYNAPGGLWLFAFCYLVFQLNWPQSLQQLLITILFSIVCGIEFLQLWQWTDGVFDPLDLFSYLIAVLLITFLRKFKLDRPVMEKSNNRNFQVAVLFFCFTCTIYLSDQL